MSFIDIVCKKICTVTVAIALAFTSVPMETSATSNNNALHSIVKSYKKCLYTVAMISTGSLLCYFPLMFFIDWFLPEYHSSLEYIAIVLPTFLFTSSITVVMFTIFKVFEMNLTFFKDSCFIFVLGFGFNILAYCLFESLKAISLASLIVTLIWFIISGTRLKQKTHISAIYEFIYLLIIAVGFLIITYCLKNILVEFVFVFVWDLVWTVVFYKRKLLGWSKILIRKFYHN